MPHNPLAWLFHSPRRLAGIVVAVVLAVSGSAWALNGPNDPEEAHAKPAVQPAPANGATRSAEPPAKDEPPAPSIPRGRSANASGEKPTGREPTHAKAVASSFLADWLNTPTQKHTHGRWLRRIRAHVTPELFSGLRHTDPANVPLGRVEKVTVTAAGAYTARFTVRLSSGTRLQLQVVDQGGSWAVANVEEAVPR